MRPSIRDDLKHHYLPIGALGLINQLANIYVYYQILLKNRPLWPTRKLQYNSYNKLLCCAALLVVLGFDITSLSRLRRWELIVNVVGDLAIFTQAIILEAVSIDLGYKPPRKGMTVSNRQGDSTINSETSTLHGDQPPPPYSKDPEKGDATIDYEGEVSSANKECIPDREAVESKYGTDKSSSTGLEMIGSSLTRAETCTETKIETTTTEKVEPDTGINVAGFVFYLVFQIPAAILVSTGIVAQLAQSLPAAWTQVDHMKPIIIVFILFIAVTVVTTCVCIVRLGRRPRPSDAGTIAKSKPGYMDYILMGHAVLSFFIVSFDKWILAALAEDLIGTKHILDASHLAIPYIVLSKLPALAL
ncbi:hypothetical protein NPX13_g439 [Xylaria arbuscula]|uniref:Uncharacterized protein n=1 Tax=Xylaria arbuscula TaxID=114810 RepID=A0A9W8TR37_9PEZI|nr:hypothetical protein NPX13_g439 [Xylaria arbuscula]